MDKLTPADFGQPPLVDGTYLVCFKLLKKHQFEVLTYCGKNLFKRPGIYVPVEDALGWIKLEGK